MYSFNNDYSEGACPEVLMAILQENDGQSNTYGLDNYSLEAADLIKEACQDKNIDVHFIAGGTPCNILGVLACLKAYEAVICVDSGHINVHETGSIEATGHKILTAKGLDGKLLPEEIEYLYLNRMEDHMVVPKMVFISNASELGTIYTKKELQEIRKVCDKYNLYLYLDGARLGSALVAENNDLTLKDINELTDMFYIGGTKNGILFGEAMVISNDNLKENFRYLLKQRGFMLAKSRILGVQFKALFTDDLYFRLARNAQIMAKQLKEILLNHGFKLFSNTTTNQLFFIIDNNTIKELKKNYEFEIWEAYDENSSVVRFVTSWATSQEVIEEFKEYLNTLK